MPPGVCTPPVPPPPLTPPTFGPPPPPLLPRIRFFLRTEKGGAVYPLMPQQQAYVGQFSTIEALCAALKAAANEAAGAGAAAGAAAAGVAGAAAAGGSASAGGPTASSSTTLTSATPHGHGVQLRGAATWRPFITIDRVNRYLPDCTTAAAAQAMHDAAVVCWARYLFMRG